MILYITGSPGSGKSYYLVNYAEKNKNKYDSIHHNIAGYRNHDQIMIDKFDDMIREAYDLFKIHKDEPEKDEILKNFISTKGFLKSLVLLDECHIILNTQKAHLVWLVTYHRHLYLDIFFATQNMSLIHSKYKIAEYYIIAVRGTLKVNQNNLVYRLHTQPNFSVKSTFSTETLKKDPAIYALYTSGDFVASSSSIKKKFITIGLVAIIPILSMLYYYYKFNALPPSPKIDQKIPQIDKNASIVSPPPAINMPNTIKTSDQSNDHLNYFDVITCLDFQCSSSNFYNLPETFLAVLIDLQHVEIKHKEITEIKKYYVMHDDQLLTLTSNYKYQTPNENKTEPLIEPKEDDNSIFNPVKVTNN